MTIGIRWSAGAGWIGYHFQNGRLCVNIIPFITVFFVFAGGKIPESKNIKFLRRK